MTFCYWKSTRSNRCKYKLHFRGFAILLIVTKRIWLIHLLGTQLIRQNTSSDSSSSSQRSSGTPPGPHYASPCSPGSAACPPDTAGIVVGRKWHCYWKAMHPRRGMRRSRRRDQRWHGPPYVPTNISSRRKVQLLWKRHWRRWRSSIRVQRAAACV